VPAPFPPQPGHRAGLRFVLRITSTIPAATTLSVPFPFRGDLFGCVPCSQFRFSTFALAWCILGANEANFLQPATVTISNCQQKGESGKQCTRFNFGDGGCGGVLVIVEVNC
jgi:hypothetical protein